MTKPVCLRSPPRQVHKMSLSIVIAIAALLFVSVRSDSVKCTVVPFETKEGLSGTCCVFFDKTPNSTKNFPKEEVAQQILNTRRAPEKKESTDDKVVFNEKSPAVPGQNKKIKGDKVDNQPTNITTANRNAFDSPELCGEGKFKDHTGDCTEPF